MFGIHLYCCGVPWSAWYSAPAGTVQPGSLRTDHRETKLLFKAAVTFVSLYIFQSLPRLSAKDLNSHRPHGQFEAGRAHLSNVFTP